MPLYLCFFITQKSWRVDNQLVVVNAVFSAAPCSAGRSAAEISAGSINSFMKPTKSLGRAWRRLSQWGTESHWANSPPSWSSHPPPLHHSLQTHSSSFSSRLLPEKKNVSSRQSCSFTSLHNSSWITLFWSKFFSFSRIFIQFISEIICCICFGNCFCFYDLKRHFFIPSSQWHFSLFLHWNYLQRFKTLFLVLGCFSFGLLYAY